MQLFWLSPLLLFPLFFFGRNFLWVIGALVLLTIGCTFTVSYLNEFLAFPLRMGPELDTRYTQLVYIATHTRMGPWLIGVGLGYILFKTRNGQIKLSPVCQLAMIDCWLFLNFNTSQILSSTFWVLAISAAITVVFLFYPFQQFQNSTSTLQNALYLAFFRNIFALSVAWIIFGCQNESGSVINWLLSRPIWQPIAKMGLSIYLTHVIVRVFETSLVLWWHGTSSCCLWWHYCHYDSIDCHVFVNWGSSFTHRKILLR